MSLKLTLFTIIMIITGVAKAQNVQVEKSDYGVQTGLLGIWGYNESRLTPKIALRTEAGFDAGLFGGVYDDETIFALTPVFNVEPRWYYNIKKRQKKGKDILHNAANFVTVQISYHPDWFVISNYNNVHVDEQISFIPTWGIKRAIGRHFVYELGIGIGYRYYFVKQYGFENNYGEGTVNLHVRLGYSF